jgi:hypothetical protein
VSSFAGAALRADGVFENHTLMLPPRHPVGDAELQESLAALGLFPRVAFTVQVRRRPPEDGSMC